MKLTLPLTLSCRWSRKWLRRDIGLRYAHCPLDAFQHHLLKSRIVPGRIQMAPAHVAHAALSVLLRPDDGKITVDSPGTDHRVEIIGIYAHDDVNLFTRIRHLG